MMAECEPMPICRAEVVVPSLPRHDAIAQAAVDTWRLLNSLPVRRPPSKRSDNFRVISPKDFRILA
jgi:hypothetical protein